MKLLYLPATPKPWAVLAVLVSLQCPVAAKPADRSIEILLKHGVITSEELEVLSSPNPQPIHLTPAELNPTYPFIPTPNGFKQWLKKQGVRVLSVDECAASRTEGSHGISPQQPLASPTRIFYQCNRVFFDAKDPRGIQRCMGSFIWANPNRVTTGGLVEITYKNDCRWL